MLASKEEVQAHRAKVSELVKTSCASTVEEMAVLAKSAGMGVAKDLLPGIMAISQQSERLEQKCATLAKDVDTVQADLDDFSASWGRELADLGAATAQHIKALSDKLNNNATSSLPGASAFGVRAAASASGSRSPSERQ